MTVNSTGWSGFNNYLYSDGPYKTTQKFTTPEKSVNRALRKGRAGRILFATLNALTGQTAGQSKALSYKRVAPTQVPGSVGTGGGLVVIETRNLVTGVTTSADLTHILAVETATNKPASYPSDKSGVRSGGRAGSIV